MLVRSQNRSSTEPDEGGKMLRSPRHTVRVLPTKINSAVSPFLFPSHAVPPSPEISRSVPTGRVSLLMPRLALPGRSTRLRGGPVFRVYKAGEALLNSPPDLVA